MPFSPHLQRVILLLLGVTFIANTPGAEAALREFTDDEGVPRAYEIRYSANRKFFARGEPTLVPVFFGTSIIEVFERAESPDPVTAANPVWRVSVRNWHRFELSNSGNTLVVIQSPDAIIRSKAMFVPSSRAKGTAVTTAQYRGAGSIRKRSFPIRAVTSRLKESIDGVLEGDIVLPDPKRSTYRWYRGLRAGGRFAVVQGFGKRTRFDLKTGRLVRRSQR